MTTAEMPYYDGLEPFDGTEDLERPDTCNCGAGIKGKPYYVCVSCYAVFCLVPGCAESHAYPRFKHYQDTANKE
jgi:hypothetical protein